MAEKRVQRRLAAILAADVVGYSRLMGEDETGTLAQLKVLRKEVFDPRTAEHNGRIVKTTGDGVLVEFASAVDATECAVKIQRALTRRNEDVPEGHRIELRIGINLGDIIVDGEDIYGDGVNVAARLEGLCDTGEVYVSAVVHDQVKGKIEVAFDDLGEHTLKNIDKPIKVYRVSPEVGVSVAASIAANSDQPLPLPDKPSIAVLPFENMSGDPDQEYFADGITEDIITALSRIRWFLVIARNSAFSYKGTSPDVRQVAKDLGVRYVLEGSVRKVGNRVRITAQLIDTATGTHIWADRYDRELEDIFAVQDEITETVVTAIEPELSHAEQTRARRKRPDDLSAWDCYQRGIWHVWRASKEDNEEAQRLFRQATAIDPQFASGFAGLAVAKLRTVIMGVADKPEAVIEEGLRAANTALSLDDREAVAYGAMGMAGLFTRNYEMCYESAIRAIDINPNYAFAYLSKGISLAHAGRGENALPDFDEFQRLSPRDPMLWISFTGRAIAYLGIEDYETAHSWTQKAIQSPNVLILAHLYHIIALTRLDRIEEARAAAREVLRIRPDISLKVTQMLAPVDPKLTDVYIEDLRKAGLPV